MKMKITVLLLSVVLILCVGCVGPESANTDDQVFTLSANYFNSENITPGKALQAACDKAEEMSDGRLQFKTYYNGTYVSWADSVNSCSSGVVDIAMVDMGNISEVFDLNNIFCLPIETPLPERKKVGQVYRDMLEEYTELQEEMESKNVRWIGIGSLGAYNLHLAKGQHITGPESIKGLIIDAMGNVSEYVNNMGASATSVDPGDYYMNLERGIMNGQFNLWASVNAFKVYEVTDTHVIYGDDQGGLWQPAMGFIINLKTWNSLPEYLQQIITECFNWAAMDLMADLDVEIEENVIKECQEIGNEFIYVSDEEREEWAKYMKEPIEKWIADVEAKGWSAQEAYDLLIEKLVAASGN